MMAGKYCVLRVERCQLLSGFVGFGEAEAEVAELRGIDRGGRVGHGVGAGLRFRERDHLADVLFAREDRGVAVDADGETRVRWRAVAERVEQEPEPLLRVLRVRCRAARRSVAEYRTDGYALSPSRAPNR